MEHWFVFQAFQGFGEVTHRGVCSWRIGGGGGGDDVGMTGKNGGTVFVCCSERIRKCTALGFIGQVSLAQKAFVDSASNVQSTFTWPHVPGQSICNVEVQMK